MPPSKDCHSRSWHLRRSPGHESRLRPAPTIARFSGLQLECFRLLKFWDEEVGLAGSESRGILLCLEDDGSDVTFRGSWQLHCDE